MAKIVSVKAEVNGETYDLTAPSSGSIWSKSVTAPAQTSGSNNAGKGPGVGTNASGLGYYPVKITVTDDYGNTTVINTSTATLGDSLKLKVLEKVAPVASITYPAQGASITSGKPTIKFKLTDSGSGVRPDSCYIVIDSGTAQKVTATVNGTEATASFTPSTALTDGQHTIKVYGSDYDGNKSNEATATFKVDTTPPILNITAPTDGQKFNKADINIVGTTNDALSSPVTIAVKLNDEDQGSVTVAENGAFTKGVTLAKGSNTIVITATDASGLTSSVTRTVSFSDTAPVVTAITLVPNPADAGASVVISVTVQETD